MKERDKVMDVLNILLKKDILSVGETLRISQDYDNLKRARK